ncbi:MAG: ATP-binding protein [Deltaproteobacteria bacterium]|nr:ATP-binding protein [Deltaproteobacteria bacterium]
MLLKSLPSDYDSLGPTLELILEEHLTNIFKHGYKGHPGPVEMSCFLVNLNSRPHLSLRFKDWGLPFDPFDSPVPNTDQGLEERPIGGLGVHLIRKLSAQIIYYNYLGINTVELAFPRPYLG